MLQDNELYQEIADGMATYIKYKMYLMNKIHIKSNKLSLLLLKINFNHIFVEINKLTP